eukprot:scaffold2131_cov192-Alexandrium_tamarense.AAC.4
MPTLSCISLSSSRSTTCCGGSRKAACASAKDPLGESEWFGPTRSDGKDAICWAGGHVGTERRRRVTVGVDRVESAMARPCWLAIDDDAASRRTAHRSSMLLCWY